jgi:mRNA-capping enzyme
VRRYGDPSDPPLPAPPLPDWCYDEEDGPDELRAGDSSGPNSDEVGGSSSTNGHGSSSSSSADAGSASSNFMEGVKGVVQITRQPTLGQVQKRAQELCNFNK